MTSTGRAPGGGAELRRSLGLFACTVMGVGVILGAGIYALVGKAAAIGGNALWLSFLAAAVFAGLTGLSYAELSSFIPRAGGEYHYVRRAFGEGAAFVVTWLLLAGLTVVSATVAIGFGGYFERLTGLPIVPSAVGVIVLATAILIYGIRESAWLAGFCTAVEILGLFAILVIGAPHLGDFDLMEAPHGLGGILSAAALIFFAYIGFEEIVQLSEEAHDPTRTIPRALLLSIVVTTVIYALVAIAAVSVVGWEELGASDSPLADVVAVSVGRRSAAAMAMIALFSTFNTVLVMLLSAARLTWGTAEDGALPRVLSRVHESRQTPWVATLLVAAVAASFVVTLRRIELVASVSNFALFIAFSVINAALIRLRFTEPDTPRPFRVPGRIGRVPLIPALGIIGAVIMMARTALLPALLAGGLVVSGILVHVWIRHGARKRA